jgi:pimeloyl-ACP methyl ester carboxylesterase
MTRGQERSRYTVDSVTSRDGTTISYRRLGHGPGIVAVHGGAQAAQNLMDLATALAESFSVYVPDRRGRGLSGPPGDSYGLILQRHLWGSVSAAAVVAGAGLVLAVAAPG